MKIYGQVQYVQPMYLIISLPNQLFAHVPVTNVSTQLLKTLETEDSDAEEEEEEENGPVSDLSDIFTPGQYVRSVVQAVHPAGYTDPMGLSKSRDDIVRASRRVELSLLPEKVNAGLKMADLVPGFVSAVRHIVLSMVLNGFVDHDGLYRKSRRPRLSLGFGSPRSIRIFTVQGRCRLQETGWPISRYLYH